MKKSSFLIIFLVLSNVLFGQNITVKENAQVENLITGGYNTIYQGLDSVQLLRLIALEKTLKANTEVMTTIFQKSLQDEKFKTELNNQMIIMAAQQNEINRLISINDSILKTSKGDSLYLNFLKNNYNKIKKEYLGDFWEQYPDFDPFSGQQCAEMIEKFNNIKFNKLEYNWAWDASTQGPKNVWNGIEIEGIGFQFNSKEFESLRLNIKGSGIFTIGELRQKFEVYQNLKTKQDYFVNNPFKIIKKNKNMDLDSFCYALNNNICLSVTGNVVFENFMGERIYLFIYKSGKNCGDYDKLYEFTVQSNEKIVLNDILAGGYKYCYGYSQFDQNRYDNSSRSNQLIVIQCSNQTIKLR